MCLGKLHFQFDCKRINLFVYLDNPNDVCHNCLV